MSRRTRISLAVFVAIATMLMSLAGLVGTSSPASAAGDPEQDMFTKTNQARTANSLPTLQWDAGAANIARAWSQHMAGTATLAHNPNLVDQINSQVTTQWTRIGENVGYGPDTTALQNAFMNSAPHRANILGDYNRVGVGAAFDGNGTLWVTLDFIKGPDLGPPPGSPFGNLENAVQVANGIRVMGWAIDPDTSAPIEVHIYVDGGGTNLGPASNSRPDVGQAFPGSGSSHGFDAVVGAGPGWHNVCAYGINVSGGGNSLLGCRQVPVYTNPFGNFESAVQVLGGLQVAGWAIDPETSAPIQVHVYVDSGGTNLGTASNSRPDVGSYFAYAGYGDAHGFSGFVGAAPGFHWVCAYGINVGAGATRRSDVAEWSSAPSPFGNLEVAAPATGGIHVAGWAIDPDTAASIQVHVYVDGGGTNLGPASGTRSDVGSYFSYAGYGANHGFDTVLAEPHGSHQVCVYAINVASGWNTTLSCRTVNVP